MHLHSSSKTGGSSAKSAWVILGIDSRLSIVLYVGMPRKLRIEYPGAMYHVMSRGDRREKIYLDDVDRQDFIKTLAEACQKTNWQVPAYCLMPNHYHLVLETPEPNLVAGMAWLQSTYTIRLNHRHQLFGHVLSGSRASAEAKAERIIAEELQRQGWQEADLLVRLKNDAAKLEIAARLRRETTLSTKAIAARVHLGSTKAANRSLHSYMRGGAVASAGQGQLGL
jgi:Transposase and inactivated derivatives